MLYKNNLKKIRKNRFEFFLFTLFFTISIFLYVVMNTSLISMKASLKKYIQNQNIEDFSFTLDQQIDLDEISRKYQFVYEKENKKWIQEKNKMFEVYYYDDQRKINKPYLIKGEYPKIGEVTISDKYVKKNHLKIGDKIKINEKEYRISGFMYQPSLIYMVVAGKVYSNHKNVTNVFMNIKDYEDLSAFEMTTYVCKYNQTKEEDFFLNYLSGEKNPFQELEKDLNFDDTLFRMMSIYYLRLNLELYQIFSKGMFLTVMILCLFTYILMFQRKLKKDKREIALLKMMGYKKIKIIFPYLLYPFCSLFFGFCFGIFLGKIFHKPFMSLFLEQYQMPILSFFKGFSIKELLFIMLCFLILLFINFIFFLRKDILRLLKEKSHKISFFKRKIKQLCCKFPFQTKIQISLFLERMKLSLFTFLLCIVVSFFLLFILIGKDAVDNMISSTFKNVSYDYEIIYSNFQKKKREGDLVLKYNGIYQTDVVSLFGVKNKTNYIRSYELKDNEIVINENMSQKYNLKKGNLLKVKINEKEYEFYIKEIDLNYQDNLIYLSFQELNEILNLENCYNIRYIKEKEVDNLYEKDVLYVTSKKEAEESMRNVFSIFEILINFIFVISSICLVFLFCFLSNMIVEDHQKNILLLKLFGYSNKSINKIFLHTYDFLLILSYIIAIFLIIPFFDMISNFLLEEQFVFHFNFAIIKFILGFLLLFLGYFISLSFSKRKLKKYEISELLKREE